MIRNLLIVLFLSFRGLEMYGQAILTTSPYTQDFNTLALSGSTNTIVPTGWAFLENPGNTTYAAGTGSDNAGNTYSFGAAAIAERSFGGLLSGSVTPTVGASFTNNSGQSINSLTITYTGEQWRIGALGREDRLDFQYSLDATTLGNGTWIDVNLLDFIAPNTTSTLGALDGNNVANKTLKTNTISSLSIPNGATFFIRWTDFNASGSDDGLSVDDFTLAFSGTVTCTPPTIQSTNFNGINASLNSMDISWMRGNGDNVIVLAKAGSAVNASPVNGSTYSADAAFGSGAMIGTGNYVLYNGSGSNVSVTALAAGTNYYYAIYEFNTTGACYMGMPLTGSYSTLSAPAAIYRSVSSGPWNTISVWESSTNNGLDWSPAVAFPTSSDDLISISNGNAITMSENKTLDQLTIEAGGSLEILTGQLTINNGASAEDLIINGSLINSSTPTTTIAVNSGAVVSVNNGGLYQHNTISNVYPILTWNAGSTIEIKTMTGGGFGSSNLNQVFANFTWNIPGQTAVANLAGNLTNITGNFSVLATGSTNIRLIGNTTTINVGGDFVVNSGAQVDFSQSGGSSFATLNLKGNMVINGNITETSPAGGYGIVKFSNATAQQTITLGDPDLSITENISLEIANPNGVILLSNLSFNYAGNLILNSGTIRTNGFNITAVAPAAVLGGNSTSFVCNCDDSGMTLGTGALFMDIAPSNVKIYPVGPTPAFYMPATLTGNAGTDYDYLSVRVDPLGSNGVTPTYPTQCINYQWQIDASSPASAHDINLALQWAAGTEGSSFDPNSNLVIGHWNGAKFNVVNNAIYNGSQLSATSTMAFTSFSPFVVASGFSPLPINLLSFTATKSKNGVQLVWNTANEVDNKYFIVEKSTNGIDFESLVTIKGKNQISAGYNYFDSEVKSGKYFYRLNQIDFDGANSFSQIVSVNYSNKNIELYPTITRDLVRVETEISNWKYEIFDINGNLKLSGARTSAGSLDFTSYPNGIYFIKIIGDETNTYKIIKY